jgi:hypothetical protein
MRDTGWFKSTRSGGGTDNCVQVRITDTATGVRDSKNPTGGQLTLGNPTFRTFLTSLKSSTRH